MTEVTCLDKVWRPAVNIEPRKNGLRPTILLMHYTGMESAEGAIEWLCSAHSRVSCHYLIDEAGNITHMVDENMRAWHAGQAYWSGETDINSASIGIEISNVGHDAGYPDFPAAQMQAVEALSLDVLARHDIKPRNVLAHSDVAPSRKADPGEKFDWQGLADAGVGHWVAPVPLEGDTGFGLSDQGPNVARFQARLREYGYDCPASGSFCDRTRAVVTAFQRHFRTELVDGRADSSTVMTLDLLLEALSG